MLAENIVIDVVSVTYLEGYRLAINFSDGHVRTVDFEPFLKRSIHPEIRKYLDLDLFKQFRIVYGQLDWNDYDLCSPSKISTTAQYESGYVKSNWLSSSRKYLRGLPA